MLHAVLRAADTGGNGAITIGVAAIITASTGFLSTVIVLVRVLRAPRAPMPPLKNPEDDAQEEG